MFISFRAEPLNSNYTNEVLKMRLKAIFIILVISTAYNLVAQQTNASNSLVDAEPKVLHEGTISNNLPQWNNHFNRKLSIGLFTILENGKSRIIYYPYVDERFLEGVILPFDEKFEYSDPWMNLNGDYILLTANIDKNGGISDQFRICESKYINGQWTQPSPILETYRIKGNIGSPSLSKSGSLYFNAVNDKGDFDIFVLKKGSKTPLALPKHVNSEYFEGDFYIDDEEEFIVFSSANRDDSQGNSDLYISFNEDGDWTPAISLGNKVNTPAEEFSPYISTDRRQLVFTSDRFQSRGFIPTYNHFIVDIDLEQIRKIFGE